MDMSAAEVKRAASAQPHPSQSPEPNGSEILVRCLQAEGVKFLWGYPGGAVLYIYDALYKQDSIHHVLVRHEQAAVHAAMPVPPAMSASRLSPPAPASPMR
jgi:acetolactate synthase-1/2/3 large subunit